MTVCAQLDRAPATIASVDHVRRVARLLRGDRHVTDLDRLFSDLRSAVPGRPTVTELGDFAAHRQERDKGVVIKRAADMQVSGRIWVRQLLGIAPSLDEARAAGYANLNVATDEQIRNRLGVSRQAARSRFVQGMNKLAKKKKVNQKERDAINYLGTSFLWLYAFDDRQLIQELSDVLVEAGALATEDREAFASLAPFVTLYALALMNGARLRFTDYTTAPLRLCVRAGSNTLWIKAEIPIEDIGKPIGCRLPVFQTSLNAAACCAPELLENPALMDGPVEIGAEGRLVAIV